MKWKTTKKASELKLDGIKVEVETSDGAISSVTFTDSVGNTVQCKVESYSFKVQIPAPPEMEKKWKCIGTVAGVPVDHTFDDQWNATQAKQDYESKVRHIEDAVLEVKQVEVPVEE